MRAVVERVRTVEGAPPGDRRAETEGAPPGELEERPGRELGHYDTGRDGPTVIVVAGLHGNEPGGVGAAREVLARLVADGPPLRGRVIALAGNLTALERGVRFVDRDLNRTWTEDALRRLRGQPPELDDHEDRELRDLLARVEGELDTASGPVFLLDLHSTSAAGAPFTVLADTLPNRRVAELLPIPMILGLEELIVGPLLSWIADLGHAAIVVEGGRHGDESTARHHAAAIWLTLVASGALELDDAPQARHAYSVLRRAARGLPGVLELLEGHPLRPEDGFRMEPDFDNFKRVSAGELLARDRGGAIRAPWTGFIVMPLYQGQGEDGFFLAREASWTWLQLSAWARTSGLERLLGSLPGVRPHPRRGDALLAEPSGLRPVVRAFLRLFGFRKRVVTPEGAALVQRRQT